MFKTLVLLAIVDTTSFIISLITTLSNEWFSLSIRNNECPTTLMDVCLLPGFQRVFTFGYWYLCPLDSAIHSTWVFSADVNQCHQMQTHNPSASRLKATDLIARGLKNNQLLDIEIEYADVIQCLSIIGTTIIFCISALLLAMIAYILVTGMDNFKYRAEYRIFKPLFEAVFFLHLLEITVRTTAFTLISIYANNYLDFIIRTSYSTFTGNLIFHMCP